MSEYKEKYELTRKKLDGTVNMFDDMLQAYFKNWHTIEELQLENKKLQLKISELEAKLNNISTKVEEERIDNDDLDSMFAFDKKQQKDRDNLASEIFKKYKAKHWSK